MKKDSKVRVISTGSQGIVKDVFKASSGITYYVVSYDSPVAKRASYSSITTTEQAFTAAQLEEVST